jgi:thymidylate synthase (FAD)
VPIVVRVIAHTTFVGVPSELMPPAQEGPLAAKGQDQGTDAERLIECAGRTCYDSYGRGRPSDAYHQHIMEVDHGSVTEHASLSFFISGVSRGCTHELVRHRVGVAISQRSTRYVDEGASAWALHPLLVQYFNEKDKPQRATNGEQVELSLQQQAFHVVSTAKRGYAKVVEAIEAALVDAGVDKLTARKQARGAARGLLGNALSTELVWTANVRALKNVLAQRAKAAADAEIRLLANALYEAALPYWPTYLGCYEKVPCPDGIGFELVTRRAGAKP